MKYLKPLPFYLLGAILGAVLMPLILEWITFVLQPDYVRCDGGMTYDLGKMSRPLPH